MKKKDSYKLVSRGSKETRYSPAEKAEYEFYSDVTGNEIDEKDLYLSNDKKLCSREEAINLYKERLPKVKYTDTPKKYLSIMNSLISGELEYDGNEEITKDDFIIVGYGKVAYDDIYYLGDTYITEFDLDNELKNSDELLSDTFEHIDAKEYIEEELEKYEEEPELYQDTEPKEYNKFYIIAIGCDDEYVGDPEIIEAKDMEEAFDKAYRIAETRLLEKSDGPRYDKKEVFGEVLPEADPKEFKTRKEAEDFLKKHINDSKTVKDNTNETDYSAISKDQFEKINTELTQGFKEFADGYKKIMKYVFNPMLGTGNIDFDINDFIVDKYPFDKSFDEYLNIPEWCENCIKELNSKFESHYMSGETDDVEHDEDWERSWGPSKDDDYEEIDED